MALSEKGKRILKNIPHDPGVYVMKDARGKVLYIGKAKDLRNRVKSYFDSNTPHSPLKAKMVRLIEDVEFIAVTSEEEALILEANLVKFNQPPFNVDLKDGKQYPYIKVTSEEFPAICMTRDLKDVRATYYGPFTSARSVKNTVKFLVAAFKLRECKRMKPKGCVKSQIGLCSSPCTAPEDNLDYSERIKVVDGLLRGRGKGLLRKLKKMMDERTKELRFEEAAALRDIIADIKRLDPTQKVSLLPDSESDIFVMVRDEKIAPELNCVLILKVRESKVISENFFFVDSGEVYLEERDKMKMEAEMFREALLKYYVMSYIPKKIIIEDHDGLDIRGLEDTLKRIKGENVKIVYRQTGKTKRLLKMAGKNAVLKIQAKPTKGPVSSRIRSTGKDPHQDLVELKNELGMDAIPYRIEAFDISNLQGDSAVGSLVIFVDAFASKKDYRRYTIRTVSGINDFEMIKEVVMRRYSKNPLPDLILIDGGSIQVDFAVRALTELGLKDHQIIGLAKRNEEIFLPGRKEPIVLNRRSSALLLLQRIRDESHRFAIGHHRKRRKKRTLASQLDDIPGLGEKRKRLLLRRFGSVKRLKEASVEELKAVPGVGDKLAEIIVNGLKS